MGRGMAPSGPIRESGIRRPFVSESFPVSRCVIVLMAVPGVAYPPSAHWQRWLLL